MHVLLLIVGIGLLPQACSLKCYECMPGLFTSCTRKEIECSDPNHLCMTSRTATYARQWKMTDTTIETCALPEQCDVSGSISLGSFKVLFTNSCCTTDRCNNQAPPEINASPNGKKCYYCSILSQSCSSNLDCLGEEDYCFTSKGSSGTSVKGCASKIFCSGLTSNSNITQEIGTDMSCCQGDYCNNDAFGPKGGTSAASISSVCSAGVLLLLPLLYFTVFS